MSQDQNTIVNEPESEPKIQEVDRERGHHATDTPLFLRDGSEGDKGNAQDEKDKTKE